MLLLVNVNKTVTQSSAHKTIFSNLYYQIAKQFVSGFNKRS